MKKKTIMAVLLLGVVLAAGAKEKTIVIRKGTPMPKGKTEVTSHGDGTADTLTVTPGTGTTAVVVTVEDAEGNLLDMQSVNANMTATLSIAMPDNGATLRIRDDQEVVYEEEN